jgi:hypothetical protein
MQADAPTPPAPSSVPLNLAAVPAGCLVIASAGFGAVFAWQTGSTHGPLLGCLSVLMALGLEAAKPLAVSGMLDAAKSWQFARAGMLALLAAVAVLFSLTAELQLMARGRADGVAERQSETTRATDAQRVRDRLDRELAALPKPTRSVAELEPVIAGKLASRRDLDGCTGWLPDAKARTICIEIATLKADKAKAESWETLRTRLDEAEATAAATGTAKTADPGSAALAAYLEAVGLKVDPSTLGNWLVLVGVIALEVGSALAGVLAKPMPHAASTADVSSPARAALPSPVQPPLAITAEPAVTPATTGVADTGQGARHSARQKVIDALKANGGTVTASQRELAARVGVSPARVGQVLSALAADGTVTLRTGTTSTRVVLA